MKNFDKIKELIECLMGTCKSFTDGCNDCGIEESEISEEEHEMIDNEIFLCDTCGWWLELSEMSHDGENCLDCSTDEED
jgi:hypothetical protein